MSIYIVGDIQGCYEPLQRLLEKVNFDPASDRLWCPGDLVNRGGQSLKTLRLLESLGKRFQSTLGNHDLYLLKENWKYPDGGCPNREMNKILKAHDRERLMEWLRFKPLAHYSKKHNILMVHAGVVPQWSLEDTLLYAGEVEQALRSKKDGKFYSKMSKNWVRRWNPDRKGWRRRRLITNILTRLRFCDKNGKILASASGPPGSMTRPYKPWFKHKHRQTRDVRIVFGHWAALGLYDRRNVTCLDTGCVWGGRLTALRVQDNRFFRVRGRRRWKV